MQQSKTCHSIGRNALSSEPWLLDPSKAKKKTIVVRNFMCIAKPQSSQQGTYIWINMDYLDLGDDAIKHIVVLFLRKKNTSRVMLVAININGHQRIDNLH